MVRCGAAKWQCRSRPVIPAFWSDLTFFAESRRSTHVGSVCFCGPKAPIEAKAATI
jgi:hypothetical protein